MKLKVLLICFLIVFLMGYLGSVFTNADSEWYESVKPSITPPSYVFGVVWSVLYILIALSLYFVWVSRVDKKLVLYSYGSNLIFNFLWSILYFGLHNPVLAFVDILLIIISLIFMMVVSFRVVSFYLLIPYLLWVLFAAVLNFLSIW